MIPSLFLSMILAQTDVPVQVEFANGKSSTTQLMSIEDKKVQLKSSSAAQGFSQIAKLTFNNPNKKNRKTELSVYCLGRTTVQAHRVTVKDGNVSIFDSQGQSVTSFPRAYLKSIKLDPKLDLAKWEELSKKKLESDALVVERDGRIDLLDGLVKELDSDEVTFEIRERSAKVKLAKLVGILFFQTEDRHKPVYELLDVRDNKFYFDDLIFGPNGVTLICQQHKILLKPQDVQLINFSAGKFTLLSELDPQSTKWVPFLKAKTKDSQIAELLETAMKSKKVWSRNESFGKPIMMDFSGLKTKTNPVGRVTYESGISVLGGSEIVYSIPNDVVAFETTLGIQSNSNGFGDVSFSIVVDGKTVLQRRIKATDSAAHKIDIPIQGNRITLAVGYGKDNNVGDVISLGNPRFRKR